MIGCRCFTGLDGFATCDTEQDESVEEPELTALETHGRGFQSALPVATPVRALTRWTQATDFSGGS